MYADSYFSVGSSHKICQDYALSGEVDGRIFAAVADGCSSSPHTDIGARFLCLGAQQALRTSPPHRFNCGSVLPLASTFLGKWIPIECLDSTLMLVYTAPGLICVAVAGDGVVAARRRDGTVDVTELEFNNNAPAYLSYQLNELRLEAYTSGLLNTGATIDGCGLRTEKEFVSDSKLAVWEPKPDAEYGPERVTESPEDFWWIKVYSRAVFDLVAVMSDGVLSFQQKTKEGIIAPVPLQAVLQQLMKFKTVKGEFVTRRCRRFLSKYCVEHGWSHYDDLSMAAVYAEGE